MSQSSTFKPSRFIPNLFRVGRHSADALDNSPSQTDYSALSAQTSKDASQTLATLEEYLGENIDLFEADSVSDADHIRLQHLKGLGERWEDDARIDITGPGVKQWRSDPKTAHLVHVACHAANKIRVKASPAPPNPPGAKDWTKVATIGSSMMNFSQKEICLYSCSIAGDRYIVVCVRAAGSYADWMINGGFRMSEVERDFIDIGSTLGYSSAGSISQNARPDQSNLQAHSGFLTASRLAISPVASAIRKAIAASVSAGSRFVTHILFAGHSAGGAVAGLLFAHFVTCSGRYSFLNSASISLDIVTFGPPPVLSRNINEHLKARLPPSSVFLSLIAEGDPVSKMDMPYLEWISNALGKIRPFVSKQSTITSSQWVPPPVPSLTSHTIGTPIVIREENTEREGKNKKMFEVDDDALAKVAWVNFCTHFMWEYMPIIAAAF